MARETDHILIVDDSPDDASLLKQGLEDADVENPLVFTSGYDETLDYLRGWGKYADRAEYPPPLIAFLDINMPGKSGFDLLTWIRENEESKRLVVIMMSGSSSADDIARSYRLGANSYLLKPKNHGDLIKSLKHFRAYWLELNHYA
ncbi:MAG: response regulator [Opitutaceae bacterium]